jgi:photosystem II stability/assembly factor-like uncharacterized protein
MFASLPILGRRQRLSILLVVLTTGLGLAGTASASTWEPVPLNKWVSCSALAMAPTNPSRLYMGPQRAAVHRSDDQGDSWFIASKGTPLDARISRLAVSPTDQDVVLAGFKDYLGIYKSVNGGAAWRGPVVGIDAREVLAIAFHPTGAETLLAATKGGNQPGMYRSEDGGLTWTFVSTSPGDSYAVTIAFNPAAGNEVLIGTGGGTEPGFYRSVDGGHTWTRAHASSLGKALSWSPADPNRVYGLSWGEGVVRSTDGGVSFQAAATQTIINALRVVRAHPSDPDRVYVGGFVDIFGDPNGQPGLILSADAGSTWTSVYGVSSYTAGQVMEVLVDPSDPNRVVFGTHTDVAHDPAESSELGIFRSDTGGTGDWVRKTAGISGERMLHLDSDLSGGLYFHSYLLQMTMSPSGPAIELAPPIPDKPITYVYDLEVVERDPLWMHEAGTWFDIDVGGFYVKVSSDGGYSWLPTYEMLPSGLPKAMARLIAADHGTGNVVYTWMIFGGTDVLSRSDDRGFSYTEIGGFFRAQDAVVDPEDDYRLFALTQGPDNAVQLSSDGGGDLVHSLRWATLRDSRCAAHGPGGWEPLADSVCPGRAVRVHGRWSDLDGSSR